MSAATLPTYPGSRSGLASPRVSRPPVEQQTSADPEALFAKHRWGFLLEALLEGSVHWQRELDACVLWIENNADRNQRAWEPYSACERVTNLLVFLASMPAEPRERQIAPPLVDFLDESINWIYNHLEYYGLSETNNHVIGNARALLIAGVATANRAAVAAGMSIFRKWLPQLIMSGGFLRERSSHYQLIVLIWLMDALHFLSTYAGPDSEDAAFLRDYTTRMLSAASMVCDSRGQLLALIGDVSPDATPGRSSARLAHLYPDCWPVAEQVRPAVELRDGWFRISTGQDVVLGNVPGVYPPQFPTHGHCDLCSFVWIHGDTEILADPGRYRYTPDTVSLSQTSAAGHNLPTVNGLAPACETLIVNGQWWPRPYADAIVESSMCDGGIMLAHNGFARATPVARHSRKILVHDGTLIVADSFEGHGTVDVAWCWHFGRGFDAFNPDDLTAAGQGGQVRTSIEGLAGSPRVTPVSGGMPGGWISDGYGTRQPGLGICLQRSIELPAVVSTRFELKLPVNPHL